MKKLELQQGRALIIVAHPDDETIWMGGTILKNQNINWTIFALCRRDDFDRYPKFLRVAKFYMASGIVSDLEDEGIMDLEKSLPEIEKRIKDKLKNKKFDYIFTHAINGEYGHLRHKGVNIVIKKLLKEGNLVGDNVFLFSYKRNKKNGVCFPNLKSDFYFKLSEKEFKTKKNIIKNIYGFSKFSFENKSCAKTETFNKLKQI